MYKAKHSSLEAVPCLTHAINAHLDKGCKAFKAVLLDFSKVFSTLGFSKNSLPQIPLNWLTKRVHNYFTGRSQITRYPVRSQTAVVFFKALLFRYYLQPFTFPIFSLYNWLPFLNMQMTSSSTTAVGIPKAFP